MRKKKLRLVDEKSKKYSRFFVFLHDESVFEFDLNEWEVIKGEEWVEVEKKDGTEMDCFSIGNIMRVRFVHTEKKSMQEVTQLRPIPPNDAA